MKKPTEHEGLCGTAIVEPLKRSHFVALNNLNVD